MSKTRPRFTSTAAPTEADVALWESLTPEEQRAELEFSLAEAAASGTAGTADEVMARIRAKHGLGAR